MSGCVSLNEAQPFFDIYLMSYLPESRKSAIFALSKSTKRNAPIWDGIQEEDRNHFSRVPRPVGSPFVKQLSNMMMEKLILNRPNDFLSISRRKIIGISLKWLILLMASAVLLRMACFVIYMSQGAFDTKHTSL